MSTNLSPPRKSGFLRYAIPLALLAATVGGIAWLAQKLPKGNTNRPRNEVPVAANVKLAEFPFAVANWSNQKQTSEAAEKDGPVVKAFETGKKGHYDFLFKNVAGQDVDVVCFTTDCDCTRIEAAALDGSAWQRLNTEQTARPADPLPYTEEPAWRELAKQPAWKNLSADEKQERQVIIKAGAGGVVRVHWNVNKGAGQSLNVRPGIVFRLSADHDRGIMQKLIVPLVVAPAVRFLPARIGVGVLQAGSTANERFFAFSTTRAHIDLDLTPLPADGLIEVAMKPLRLGGIFSRSDIGELNWALRMDAVTSAKDPSERIAKAKALPRHALPQVLAAYQVHVTVHESKGDQQLDLGAFHRRLEISLDHIPRPEIVGPEIVGRVRGIVDIGGGDDQGKIRFKEGSRKEVELATAANVKLETFSHKPDWINVKVTRAAVQPDPKRTIWKLEVSVPENTPGLRSFEELDAVVLRVVGTPERFVRIPLEGTVSGR